MVGANDYEAQREARISKNSEKLRKLNIERAKATAREAALAHAQSKENAGGLRRARFPRRKRRRLGETSAANIAPLGVGPVRKSSRIRGEKPSLASGLDDDDGATASASTAAPAPKLLTVEEYFKERNESIDPIVTDGHAATDGIETHMDRRPHATEQHTTAERHPFEQLRVLSYLNSKGSVMIRGVGKEAHAHAVCPAKLIPYTMHTSDTAITNAAANRWWRVGHAAAVALRRL